MNGALEKLPGELRLFVAGRSHSGEQQLALEFTVTRCHLMTAVVLCWLTNRGEN